MCLAAQLEKLDVNLQLQKRNYEIIRSVLETVEGVTFRRVPEGGVENYSFLNFFLPNEDITQKVHKALSENGVDACFYWYTNNWHYINGWEHLRNLKTLGNVSQKVRNQIQKLNETDFSKSDAVISRTISSLIKIGWTVEEVRIRAENMKAAIISAL